MRERPKEPSPDLTSREQDRLLIVAYWRARTASEPNVGYGFNKGHVWSVLIGAGMTCITRPISLFLFPRLRTRRAGCLVYLPNLVWLPIGMIWFWRTQPTLGFYELDNTGRPVRFLTVGVPASIRGCTGTGRKAFLRQAAASGHGA